MIRLFASSLFLLLGVNALSAEELRPSDYVNPFIGTEGPGNVYPGAQAPFGVVQLSPDGGLPGWNRIAGYSYPDSTIAGFSHTHLSGTGAGDLYDISFLPVTLPVREAEAPLGVHSRFTHEEENASPGYYGVRLKDYDIRVELTAGRRVGVQRYRFPRNGRERRVILNLAKATNWDQTTASRVTIIDSCTIAGYRFSTGWARNQRLWFRTRFSRPIAAVRYDTLYSGRGIVATFSFKGDETTDTLLVTTAISPTDEEGARINLEAEAPADDFDGLLARTRQDWDERLGTISVEGGTKRQLTVFYTALYRALLAPTLFQDADGRYPGPDGKIHQEKGWNYYSTFSLWDTYRAAHPLYLLLYPADAGDMVRSILDFGRQNGRLPVWNMWTDETDTMIGYHAASVVSEAILKGLPGIDAKELCVSVAKRPRLIAIAESVITAASAMYLRT